MEIQNTLHRQNMEQSLLHVQVFFRHGDRTTVHNIDVPSYEPPKWPVPAGSLTNQGRARCYNLGRFLADHYKPLLNRITKHDIIAKSSVISRCIESTQLVLAGLYPPKSDDVWCPKTPLASIWHPIPVETMQDNFLISSYSKYFQEIFYKNRQHPKADKFVEDNREFFEKYIKPVDPEMKLKTILKLYDMITCEKTFYGENYTFPSWFDEQDYPTLQRLRLEADLILYRPHDDPFDRLLFFRHRTQEFLRYSLDSFEKTLQADNRPKIEILGSHDYRILELLELLEFELGFPEFASALVFELWSDPEDDEPHIRIKFIEPTKDFQITEFDFQKSSRFCKYAPSHGKACPISKFKEAVDDIISDEHPSLKTV